MKCIVLLLYAIVLQARIQAAQYAHLPLSTIGPDWIIDASDALFARQLRKSGGRWHAADAVPCLIACLPCCQLPALHPTAATADR